jgi:hypothetical protein
MITLTYTVAKCRYRRWQMWCLLRKFELCSVNQALSLPTGGVHISETNCSRIKAPRGGFLNEWNLLSYGVSHTTKLGLKARRILDEGMMTNTNRLPNVPEQLNVPCCTASNQNKGNRALQFWRNTEQELMGQKVRENTPFVGACRSLLNAH